MPKTTDTLTIKIGDVTFIFYNGSNSLYITREFQTIYIEQFDKSIASMERYIEGVKRMIENYE